MLPLRDMLFLGAWRMGLGGSGKILPSSSPSSPAPFQTCFRHLFQNTFFHGWAPYGRWRAHRTVKIHIVASHARPFLYTINYLLYKNGFPAPRHATMFRRVCDVAFSKQHFSKNVTEESGSSLGLSQTYSGLF